jgi:hypothetical protein
MERTAISPSVRSLALPIALVSFLSLTPIARAQVTTNGADSTAAPRTPALTYGVDAGIGESDNVTLSPTNKVSQTIAIADADFTVDEKSRLLDVNAKGNFSYLDYLQNAYNSQLIGRFDGVGTVAIVPDRLTWTLSDDFGQAALDPFTPVTPTNIESINYFSTGPDLSTRFGGVNYASLSARYARTEYETSPFNSNRLIGSAALGRDLSAGATVSLHADTNRVMFENTVLNTDFNRTSAFGRYEFHGARTEFSGDAGATNISQAGVSTTGALFKVKASRELSAAATLTLTAGRELTDAAASFSTLQSGAIGTIGTAGSTLTSDSYTNNYATLGWSYVRNRTTIRVTGRWEKDTYAGQDTYDLKRPGAEFSVERQLTHALSAQVIGRWYKTDYFNAVVTTADASSNYDDGLIGASLSWRHGRGLEIRLRADHDAHEVSAGGGGYHENRVFLTVGYRPKVGTGLTEPQ